MCRKSIYLIFVMLLALCLTSPVHAANIIWVTKTQDHDLDGIQDDLEWIDWLAAEGHTLDIRIDYWTELDPNKVDELNAADLVIMSRSTSSGDHDDGDEPTLWNSVTSSMIVMNSYLTRTRCWLWTNTTSTSTENADAILLALDTSHPVFDGVTLEMDNMVITLDNSVGTGTSTFVGSTDVGNGTLIAQTLDNAWVCIAEWAAGVEFFEGSGQIAGGPRMLFVAGTQEVDGPPATAQGAWNLTAEGEQMFRNAITYMISKSQEPAAANIIWVTKTQDHDFDGIQDDLAWIDWLAAEGHNVDSRIDYWSGLDPNKVDELNAADLVIMSRSASSGDHDDGDEPTLWNSVTTPLITMNGYLVRSSRWRWMDTTSIVKGDDILLALDPNHPLFDGVTLERRNTVIFRDNIVPPGITSFVGGIDVGNGTLIAQTLSADQTWIAEWAAGVEFYAGSGQTAGGPRLLFVAGTQESGLTPQGAWDLTAEGERMFRNAIAYMISKSQEPAGANIIWVTKTQDHDMNGIQDDQEWIDWLTAEGHTVDVRIDYWTELDPNKVNELNGATNSS